MFTKRLTINFLGDSITEGYLADTKEQGFVNLVGAALKCQVNNYGIAGTRITKSVSPSLDPSWDQFFGDRVKDMDRTADWVFVFGGTNDFGNGYVELGKMGDSSLYTFYGAMDYLVKELIKYYTKEKIVFILPLYRIGENEIGLYGAGATLEQYRDAMREVLNKYQITMLDIKEKLGKAERNPLFSDGLHPNNEGHKLIAKCIIEFIKNN